MDHPTNREVGRRIREARRQRGMKQLQLASLAHIDGWQLSRVEHGHKGLKVCKLIEIANVLGVSAAELLPNNPE